MPLMLLVILRRRVSGLVKACRIPGRSTAAHHQKVRQMIGRVLGISQLDCLYKKEVDPQESTEPSRPLAPICTSHEHQAQYTNRVIRPKVENQDEAMSAPDLTKSSTMGIRYAAARSPHDDPVFERQAQTVVHTWRFRSRGHAVLPWVVRWRAILSQFRRLMLSRLYHPGDWSAAVLVLWCSSRWRRTRRFPRRSASISLMLGMLDRRWLNPSSSQIRRVFFCPRLEGGARR
jgi:hypothetical protein